MAHAQDTIPGNTADITMRSLPPSRRGASNVKPDLMIDLSRRLAENEYDREQNPTGIIDLGSAKNSLMQRDLEKWVARNLRIKDVAKGFQYNDTQGSPVLMRAAASFLNRYFKPSRQIRPSNLLVANGVTALLDTVFFNVADEGDIVLLPTPSYGMFAHDLTTRNGVDIVPIPCDDIPGERFVGEDGEFIRRVEDIIRTQTLHGRNVAALLLANPENPLGRCYSKRVLTDLANLCKQNRVHLVVDEIYGMSGGENFVSVASLDLDQAGGGIHFLWGMSKDFGWGGLRIGFMVTFNEQLHKTMRTLSMFTWVASPSAIASAKLLSDFDYLDNHYFPVFEKRLKERRQLVEQKLTLQGIGYIPAEAAIFLFVDLSPWLEFVQGESEEARELALLEHLMDGSVFLEPGSAFFSQKSGWFRLNFAQEGSVTDLGLDRVFDSLGWLEGSCKLSSTPQIRTSGQTPRKWCLCS